MSTTLAIPAPSALETARHHHLQNHLLPAAVAYRETLLADPQNLTALLGLSLLARQSNQPQSALNMAQAALAVAPTVSAKALVLTYIGHSHLALDQIPQAQTAFERALDLDNSLAAAHYGLGNAHALQENYSQAALSFTHTLHHSPRSPEAHFALAFALTKLAQHLHAIALYKQALHLRPTFAAAWLNLGVTLVAHGQPHLAEPCYQLALAVEPHNHQTQISAHLNHGHLHRSRKHFPAAQQSYESALELASTHDPTRLPETHIAFTYLHLEQNQLPQAWHSLRQAEQSDPHHHQDPEIPNARGILLLKEEEIQVPQVSLLPGPQRQVLVAGVVRPGSDLQEPPESGDPPHSTLHTSHSPLLHQAIQSFTEAESQGHKTAPSNRGNALLRLNRAEEALAAHQKAVTADPHHPGARYNLALTQLRLGHYAQGWQNYEIRWQFRDLHPTPRQYPQPRWQGQPLHSIGNAALLIYSEQGLGDTLQFLRYLPKVLERLHPTSTLILEVQPPLQRLVEAHLLHTSHSTLHTCVIPQGTETPPFTHHIPLLSLPALFQTTIDTVPAEVPYLHIAAASPAPHTSHSTLHTRRIGLAWAGNPNYPADRERSTTLQTFLPLLELPNIQWLSLQKGPATTQIAQFPQILNASENDRDLADTAALIQSLDLVISTDTAVAHLAGALGIPLWLLLPWQSDWRWMQHRPDTPWYPTARLFRQPHPNDWPALIQQVAQELQSLR